MEEIHLTAILTTGINFWTFHFTDRYVSPPKLTYLQEPSEKAEITALVHIDKLQLSTYNSGKYHAIYQLKVITEGK